MKSNLIQSRQALAGANWSYDWAVKVRAHNAAGWGPWSKRVIVRASN